MRRGNRIWCGIVSRRTEFEFQLSVLPSHYTQIALGKVLIHLFSPHSYGLNSKICKTKSILSNYYSEKHYLRLRLIIKIKLYIYTYIQCSSIKVTHRIFFTQTNF